MNLYKSDKAQEPFLFLRNIEGSTSSFQSFTYPGWFIATASEEGQPVTLTNERGKTYNTNFYFDPEQHMPPGVGRLISRREIKQPEDL